MIYGTPCADAERDAILDVPEGREGGTFLFLVLTHYAAPKKTVPATGGHCIREEPKNGSNNTLNSLAFPTRSLFRSLLAASLLRSALFAFALRFTPPLGGFLRHSFLRGLLLRYHG
jgi:hypothetical protein